MLGDLSDAAPAPLGFDVDVPLGKVVLAGFLSDVCFGVVPRGPEVGEGDILLALRDEGDILLALRDEGDILLALRDEGACILVDADARVEELGLLLGVEAFSGAFALEVGVGDLPSGADAPSLGADAFPQVLGIGLCPEIADGHW